jgi:hypothetical protein
LYLLNIFDISPKARRMMKLPNKRRRQIIGLAGYGRGMIWA